jgi:large subunit ribosomal protein L32
MAVSKRKTSHSRHGLRLQHDKVATPKLVVDKKTKSVHLSHHVDLKTGFYKGKQILFKEEAAAEA